MNTDSNARVLIACATHWTTSIAYFTPVAVFAGWLTWVTVREKRQARAAKASSAHEPGQEPAPEGLVTR